jgi:hypothetical protein
MQASDHYTLRLHPRLATCGVKINLHKLPGSGQCFQRPGEGYSLASCQFYSALDSFFSDILRFDKVKIHIVLYHTLKPNLHTLKLGRELLW